MRPGPAVILMLVVLGASCESAEDAAWRACRTATFGQPPPAGLQPFTTTNVGCPDSADVALYSSSSGGEATSNIDALEACLGHRQNDVDAGPGGLDCSQFPDLAVSIVGIDEENDPFCCSVCCVFESDGKVIGEVWITD